MKYVCGLEIRDRVTVKILYIAYHSSDYQRTRTLLCSSMHSKLSAWGRSA